jgi:ABC-type transport system substrate-binding protein
MQRRPTHLVRGTFTLTQPNEDVLTTDGCRRTGVNADVGPEMTITVRDANGKLLATSRTEFDARPTPRQCRLSLTFADRPELSARVWDGARRFVAALLVAALLSAGCSSTSPSASPTLRPAATASGSVAPSTSAGFSASLALPSATVPPSAVVTGAPSGPPAKTIRVALQADSGGFGPLSNASSPVGDDFQKAGLIDRFLHAALYRSDAQQRPIPDLATCTPDAAGTTITCVIARANFQNGDPVTADDVAFTYRLDNADTGVESEFYRPCISTVLPYASGCLFEVLDRVEQLDGRTVAFHLKRPYAPFFTLVLPGVWIDSRSVVMDAYAAFQARATGLDPRPFRKAADDLTTTIDTPAADCEPPLAAAVALLARAGVRGPDRADYNALQGGEFDACAYAIELVNELAAVVASLSTTGDAAIAAIYPVLAFNRAPVGAGPYRLVSFEPGKRVVVEADPGYHGGPVVTPRFEFDIYPDVDAASEAVRLGKADWTEAYFHAPPGLVAAPNVQIGFSPLPAYEQMIYNVRPGRLFADVNLRRAINLCIDNQAMARAADAIGIPAITDMAAGWWGYNADLKPEVRDVAAARKLLEVSGWRLGPDGIYAKGGRRLSATVYVRTNAPDRVKYVNLLSLFVRECGMDLHPNQEDFGGALRAIGRWPNTPPDSKEPFDLYFLGWISGPDPLPLEFTTREITRKELPDGQNMGGFTNARIDEIVDKLLTTYDIDARAALYREYQAIVADQRPALFAWHRVRLVALTPGLRSVDGPLDLGATNWSWAPERMVLLVA